MTTKNSDLVANFEATPQVANPAHELHGVKRVAQGTIALAAGDIGVDDVVMLAPVPSNASITSIKIANDDLDSATTITADVGLYTTSGAVAAVAVYSAGSTNMQSPTEFADVEAEYAFATRAIDTCGQQVWEDAGATSDPGGFYYVAVTFPTAGDQAGDLSFIIEYVVN